MKTHNHISRTKGVTNLELLVFVLIAVCAWAGVVHGIKIGASYGTPGKWIGGIAGLITGVVAAGVYVFVAALINEPFDRFWRWWRPYPPMCENGKCEGLRANETCKIPEDIIQKIKGISWLGWRCKCGNLCAGGFGYGMRNRWVRVLANGEIRPYLKHRSFGRWIPDDGVGIGVPGKNEKIEKALDNLDRVKLPGWVMACLLTVIFGSVAAITVWNNSGFSNPIGPWFVVACSAMGLVFGSVAWWLGPSKFH